MTATLGAVAAAIGGRITDPDDVGVELCDATHDSRAVTPGSLFCAVPGSVVDGHRFVVDAVAAGAAAVLVEQPTGTAVGEIVVDDVRAVMGVAAAEIHGHPSRSLTVIGVTGTNGKSSVVQLLADIWGQAGLRSEVYGTLTGPRTTPEATDLQRRLAASRDSGVAMVAIEVSSHALVLNRVAGTRFAAGVFTNLGRDHLDFHHDLENYHRAKRLLFDPGYTSLGVINRDDPAGARLTGEVTGSDLRVVGYGLDDAVGLILDGPRARFTWRDIPVVLHLPGRHNVANALAAAATAAELGVDPYDIADALCRVEPVRGRFELVNVGQPFLVAVDYAHTPDALEAVLAAGREIAPGRVILVFGCGGDRDKEKRPEMGRVAQQLADVVFVTSDNPRSEDPSAIIGAVIDGMDPADDPAVSVVPDRREAITRAVAAAGAGDLVLVAGKGHETEQVVGDRVLPFDDRAVAIEAIGANR
ncbi:MAG: UDP-N-acetylmuramoyl-L-alanyl-D-glutamate--2,6-diaminopimelate ligase [Acidimicrobiales bacterium]